MGRGVPPGNKSLVWVKECKPREKEKISWSHGGQRIEFGGWSRHQTIHKALESVDNCVFLHHQGNRKANDYQHCLIGTQKPSVSYPF